MDFDVVEDYGLLPGGEGPDEGHLVLLAAAVGAGLAGLEGGEGGVAETPADAALR